MSWKSKTDGSFMSFQIPYRGDVPLKLLYDNYSAQKSRAFLLKKSTQTEMPGQQLP